MIDFQLVFIEDKKNLIGFLKQRPWLASQAQESERSPLTFSHDPSFSCPNLCLSQNIKVQIIKNYDDTNSSAVGHIALTSPMIIARAYELARTLSAGFLFVSNIC